MKKAQLFQKMKPLKENDRILLLTHTDMDGATKVVMDQMFENVDVWHCPNNNMSYLIKKAVMEESPNYDAIVVTDISCNKADAEVIDRMSGSQKLVLLDHHETAKHLNQYRWASVESDLVEDSFRAAYFKGIDGGHSSGTSLLYDFLDYQGHTKRVENKSILEEYVHNVALFDTWDWNNLFDQAPYPRLLADIEDMYGISMFERLLSERIKQNEPMINDTDREILSAFKEKEKEYIESKVPEFKEGVLTLNGKQYDFVMSVSDDHLGAMFDRLKEDYPDTDLYLVNYGTGVSFRAIKDSIHIGSLVAPFGGGGHAGAGGLRIDKDFQIKQVEKMMPGARFYLDRNEKGYLQNPKDVEEKEVNYADYKDLSVKEALMKEAEDRKRNAFVFSAVKGSVSGTLQMSGDYQLVAIAFVSREKESILEEMKKVYPETDTFILCGESGFEMHGKLNKVLAFTEEVVLDAMETVMNGAEFSLDTKEVEL